MSKGLRIKSRRNELNISQTELAKKLGISKQTLYKYENDIVTNIPSDNIEKLALALDVSPAWIMGFSFPAAIVPSSEEQALISAYRSASNDTKNAVCAVLGISREKESSTLSNKIG